MSRPPLALELPLPLKCAGRGLALELAPPRPGQQPHSGDLHVGFQIVLCFVLLFISPQQGGLSLLLGGNWGREDGLLPSPQLCLHFPVRDCLGPNLSLVLCIPSEKCYLISLWALQGRGRVSQGVTIQRGLEGREEGFEGGKNSADSSF